MGLNFNDDFTIIPGTQYVENIGKFPGKKRIDDASSYGDDCSVMSFVHVFMTVGAGNPALNAGRDAPFLLSPGRGKMKRTVVGDTRRFRPGSPKPVETGQEQKIFIPHKNRSITFLC